MKSLFRSQLSLLTLFPLAWTSSLFSGTDARQPAAKAPASAIAPTPVDDWKFTASAYGWLAGLEGTTGIKGFKSEIDVPFSKILDHLDMTATLNFEAQKGRWGGWIDGMYLKASAGGNTPEPLLDTVNVSVTQVAAEAAVFYRVWESDRGSLDLYAGARYMSMKGDLTLSVSNSGAEQVAENLSSRVIDQIVSGVKSKALAALVAKKPQLASQIADRASGVLDDLQAIGEAHPHLVNAIKQSERLQAAIRNAASARIDEQLTILQGQAEAAKAAARRAVDKAEKALASEMETALRHSIPSEISGSKSWVDPFIGARAYYHFTDRFYGIAKADIGGFGISSDLTWQAYAAFGYHLSKRTSLELGYKYMAVDYTDGGFTNDVRTSGLFLSMGLKL